MSQVPKKNALHFIFNKAGTLEESHVLRVENHKNDRYLELTRTGDGFLVRESGYTHTEYKTDLKGLKPLLGRIIEDEFPRSHQLRIKIRAQEQ